jgi:hypothetical protein
MGTCNESAARAEFEYGQETPVNRKHARQYRMSMHDVNCSPHANHVWMHRAPVRAGIYKKIQHVWLHIRHLGAPVHVCMYVCMYAYICVRVCMYVCLYACMYVCVCEHLCAYVCTSLQNDVYVRIHTHTHTHVHIYDERVKKG